MKTPGLRKGKRPREWQLEVCHTFASRLASAGVPLQVIARALGHTSIAMSQRYARPSSEAMLKVLDALGANDSANTSAHQNGGR